MAYGVQPTFKQVLTRFAWATLHVFYKRKDWSPYTIDGEGDLKPVARTGWDDWGHALKNIFKEGWRILKQKRQQ